MTIKILINALGEQTIAEVKQVENSETNEILAYWLREPRVIAYQPDENGGINIRFISTCLAGITGEYSVRAEHIVSILDPREEVLEAYRANAFPTVEETAVVAEQEGEVAPTEVVAEEETAPAEVATEAEGEE